MTAISSKENHLQLNKRILSVVMFTFVCYLTIGLPLAVGGLLSISWGVKVAHALAERLLRGLFCGFLVVCAVMLTFKV